MPDYGLSSLNDCVLIFKNKVMNNCDDRGSSKSLPGPTNASYLFF